MTKIIYPPKWLEIKKLKMPNVHKKARQAPASRTAKGVKNVVTAEKLLIKQFSFKTFKLSSPCDLKLLLLCIYLIEIKTNVYKIIAQNIHSSFILNIHKVGTVQGSHKRAVG